jgi:hypothetical protein
MKLNNFNVNSSPAKSGFTKEKRDARERRMRAFWASSENAIIWEVGRLLAHETSEGTLANLVLNGEVLEMDSLISNGRTLPLAQGFRISMSTINVWGCPVCQSAHGSGVGPSSEKNAVLFAKTKWYYNPKTKLLFTISETCWGSWVKAIGAAKQFHEVPIEVAKPKQDKESKTA